MTRLLFLPVNRYSVEYTVASGRPFSVLDRLVLRAITEHEGPTIDQLKETFQLPQRPLLENLVTLFHAGWIAMNSQGRFLPTDEGLRALTLRTLPLSMRTRPGPPLAILMETLTGMCVAARDGLHYDSKQDLRKANLWPYGRRLDPMITRSLPDQGVVRSLVQPRRGEWIHSIKEPVPRGRNAYFLRVLVDPESSDIVGLPERWLPRLSELLLEEAQRAPVAPEEVERPQFNGGRFPDAPRKTTLHAADLITTADEHERALHDALSFAPAGSWLIIAGESIDPVWLENKWAARFATALLRGVNIDLLWRTIDRAVVDQTAQAQLGRFIAAVNQAATGQEGRGGLRANPTGSRSRARFIFVVPPEPDPAEAWIGGWEWLAPVGDREASGASVRIRELALLAELAHTVAGLFESATSRTLSALPDAWIEIAERLDRLQFTLVLDEDPPEGNCEVRLLRDREIDRSIADSLNRAERIHIRTRSDNPSGPLLQRLRNRIRNQSVFATIRSATMPAEAPELFGSAWGTHAANIAEAAIADQSMIVSSVPVSGSAGDEATLADVGLAIEGGPVVEKLHRLWAGDAATAD